MDTNYIYRVSDGLDVTIQGNPDQPLPVKIGYAAGVFPGAAKDLPKPPGVLRFDGATLVRVPAPPGPVPAVISPAQLREWLIRNGQLDAVNAALAAIADPITREIMQSWFEFASEIRRDNPKVLQLGAALGMTAEQIDDAFRAAALL